MILKYQRLVNLLNCCEYKINQISAFRIFNYEYSEIVDNFQLCILEKHLESELMQLSQMFDVSSRSAIILCAMFFNSFLDTEGLVSKAISEQDLMLAVCLDTQIISELQESVCELETKNILNVNIVNDCEKSYQLTLDFISSIKL